MMKRLFIVSVVLAWLALCWFNPAGAATWWTQPSTTCANNGDGTLETCAAGAGQPGAWRGHGAISWASIQPGDTLVYAGIHTTQDFVGPVIGDPALAPITITGTAGGRVAALYVNNTTTKHNLRFVAPLRLGGESAAAKFSGDGFSSYYGDPSGFVLDGVVVKYVTGIGINLRSGQNHLVQNCYVEDALGGIAFYGDSSAPTMAIKTSIMQDNEVKTVSGDSFQIHESTWAAGDGNTIRRNRCTGVSGEDCIDVTSGDDHLIYDNDVTGGAATGLNLGHQIDGVQAYRNKIYGNVTGINVSGTPTGPANLKVFNNLVYNNTTYPLYMVNPASGEYVNNTLILKSDSTASYVIDISTPDGAVAIRNNICQIDKATGRLVRLNGALTFDGTGTLFDHNLGWRADGTIQAVENAGVLTLTQLEAANVNVADNVQGDPHLMSPDNNDFRLRKGSPAIDTGINIAWHTSDYLQIHVPQGNSTDIGAIEYRGQGGLH